ncbi:MAG TPA: TetR/AcrR family transcriptional regulator [Bacteroidia bacterium]
MTTRKEIIQLADGLIRAKGYNAFSFYDISKAVGIKTASIHYHFPSKSDLGVAVVDRQLETLNELILKSEKWTPLKKLDQLINIYSKIMDDDKVCLVGSLSTDLNTVDESIRKHLKVFAEQMLEWVSKFLEEGREQGVFHFEGLPRTRAIMIIGNLLAIVQLSRLTDKRDFKKVTSTIKKDLITI